MSNVGAMKAGWPMVAIGAVTKPVERTETPTPGTRYRQIGVRLWGVGAYEREPVDGAETRYKVLYRVDKDDIIVNKIWARNGSVAVVPAELAGCYASGEFPIFIADRNRLEPRWFHWITKTRFFWQQCDNKSHGTSGKNRIRPERFLEIEIPLPLLAEQRRIVARIEELAAKVEVARALRQQAVARTEKLIASVVSDALSDLTADRCLSHVLLESPRNGWSAQCDNAEDGVPVLRLSAVTGFTYQPEEFKRTSQPTSPDAHYWLKKGDLLITRSNTPDLVGHAAIYNGSPSPCIYPDLMMQLVVDENQVDTSFIHWWLRSTLVREYITQNAKGTSPSMKKISQKVVMNIPFPLGIPLDEQRRIVAYLDDLQARVNAVKAHQAATAAALDALLPSTLDQAFKGEL